MRTVPQLSAIAAILFLLGGGLQSCAKDASNGANGKGIQVPVDEATPEERKMLDSGVAEIEAVMSELGSPRNFRTLPLVLTTDDKTFTDRPAACVSDRGIPQFIIIKRSVLRVESLLAAWGAESTLYRVLLHEIGHCYFGRDHDDERIATKGQRIEVGFRKADGPTKVFYATLDASVMASDTLTMPIPLKKYYAAELLGQQRARYLGDFSPFASFDYIPE